MFLLEINVRAIRKKLKAQLDERIGADMQPFFFRLDSAGRSVSR